MTHLEAGDKAPQFEVTDQDGNIVTLDTFKGNKVVLFFYPKDGTPSCTKEACSLRDHYSKLSKAGYKIYGVSPDSEKRHLKFIEKFEFQYPLLSDPDKKMINDFGVWGEKKFMGKTIVGVYRTTFLIDENGVITHVFKKVKSAQHGEQILDVLNSTQH
jgi:peroxiredoxin Q/BCP